MKNLKKPKKGYKLVSWLFGKEIEIPQEWEHVKLIEKCSRKPEYGAGAAAIEKDPKLPRYIRITDLNNDGSLRDSEWKSISENDSKDYILNEGDILFARTGATVGKTYLHRKNSYKYAFAGYLIRFKPDDQNLDCEFLFNLTHSKFYWSWLTSIQTWGVQPNVNAEQYSNMPILLPPLTEQQKIASILSRVDASIESTQQVIEKTERLKKGLMQKMLTRGIGHTKFKKVPWLFGKEIEIPEEWEVKKIEELFEFIKTGTNSRSDLGNGTIMYIHYGDIHTKWNNVLDCDSDKIPLIDKTKVENLPLLMDGDLIIADASEDHEGSGASILLKNIKNRKIVSGLHTIALRDNNENTSLCFKVYLTSIKFVKIQIIAYVTGISVYGLSKKNLKKIKVPIPPLPEQQKIASILSGVDAYIQKNQEYKEKLEILKKGLMQKLLTGQIRV